jgi:hypothetical protein
MKPKYYKMRATFFILLIINYSIGFCQDSINAPLPKISATIMGTLTNAKGWLRNPEDQWINRPNRIPAFVEEKFKILIDYQSNGEGIDNFYKLELRKITIDTSNYFILIKYYRAGYYKYPSINEGYEKEKSIRFYVFKKENLEEFNGFDDEDVYEMNLPLVTSGELRDYTEVNPLPSLSKLVYRNIKEPIYGMSENLKMGIQLINTKGKIRFFIMGEGKYIPNFDTFLNETMKEYNPISSERFYYETSIIDFNKFIKIKL